MDDRLKILVLAVMCAILGCGWVASETNQRLALRTAGTSASGWERCLGAQEKLDTLESTYRRFLSPDRRGAPVLPPTAAR